MTGEPRPSAPTRCFRSNPCAARTSPTPLMRPASAAAAPMPARTAPSTNSTAWAATTPSPATATPAWRLSTRPERSLSISRRVRRPARARRAEIPRREPTPSAASMPSWLRCSTIRCSAATTPHTETFTGLAGNDLIDGRGGFDIASYNNIYFSTGPVTVNMAAGTVTGDASIGTDTLRSIEGIQGTNFNDIYDATRYRQRRRSQRRQQRHLQPVRGPWRQRHHHRQRQHAGDLQQCHRRRDHHDRRRRRRLGDRRQLRSAPIPSSAASTARSAATPPTPTMHQPSTTASTRSRAMAATTPSPAMALRRSSTAMRLRA